MKILIPALIALASWCAPASAATPSQGSKVAIPPLITKVTSKIASKPLTAILPTQAGKVSKMVTTSLTKSPSAIAIGDKYISLCAPRRNMMACSPIVATGVMKGIEVGAMAGAKGEPLITFKIDPSMAPKRAAYAMAYFLARINRQVAHFNRTEVSYAPKPWQTSMTVGATSDSVILVGGCSYDDYSDYDCLGGSYDNGGGGGDYGGGGYGGGSSPIGQCSGMCNYPSGNNNGDGDPCVAPDGSRICNSSADIPTVPVNGQRPVEEPMSLPNCRPTSPWTAVCGPTPPVAGGIPDFPQQPTPWFSQSWCNSTPALCSKGQQPDNDRGDDASTSGKSFAELVNICYSIYDTEMDVCAAYSSSSDYRSVLACQDRAATRRNKCRDTARALTDNGAHAAP
jgi:hypothetical protein